MTKGARKTGRIRGVRGKCFPKRVSCAFPIRTTLLIVGEGQATEPNYFDGLKREDKVVAKFTVTVKGGHGFSPEKVVKEAIEYKERAERRGEEFDEVWCILDVEGLEKQQSLEQAAALADMNGIRLCLSNPSFEVWLLAHFERTARAFEDCEAVIQRLNKHWKKQHKEPYRKNDERVYYRISDHTQTAISNARWVRENHHGDVDNTADCNSSTEVYRLVGHLIE
jgi:hypothetical protein